MKTQPPLSIAEQMQVLLASQDVATWSLAHLGLPAEWRDTNEPGNTQRCQQAVDQVFTLTRADIEAYFATQQILPESLPQFSTQTGARDGTYFIAKGKHWELYHQERGFPYVSASFDDLAEARKLLINTFLPSWLSHLYVPCRTLNGKKIKDL